MNFGLNKTAKHKRAIGAAVSKNRIAKPGSMADFIRTKGKSTNSQPAKSKRKGSKKRLLINNK